MSSELTDHECHERVVLVSVRGGSKPRRKVAIALPPGNDYEVFAERVRKKLNLAGISGIYHAETNIPVEDLGELQDIDDLVVVENLAVAEAGSSAGGRPGMVSATSRFSQRANASSTVEDPKDLQMDEELGGEEEEGEKKYARRGNPVYRLLVRVAPLGWFAPKQTLPVTTTGKDGEIRGSKRRQSGATDMRKVLLVFALASCMGTMFLLYTRISMGPALASAVVDETRDHIVEAESLTLGRN